METESVVEPKAEGAKCHECPLYEMGKFTPSMGPDKAAIAFIGEAPGKQEARYGQPFIGPSGKLLDTVIRANGIDRREVFLSNSVLCHPPDNAAPPASAIRACNPRLVKEIEQREVSTLVALGNSAAQAVMETRPGEGITKLRVGQGKKSSKLPGVRIIPTIHPAACLRQSDMFPHLCADIEKINAVEKPWEEPVYVVVDDERSALRAVRELYRYHELVVDIEVGIEKDTAFDHPNRYQMLCIGVSYAEGKAVVFGEEACKEKTVREALKTLFADPGIKLEAQNGKFDLAGLFPLLGSLDLYFDTMIASYVCDERPGIHGLKHQAVEILGAPQYDDDIKRYVGRSGNYALVPRQILYKYNAYDTVATRALVAYYKRKLDEEGLRGLHDFLVEASNELMYLELNGIGIDLQYLDELTDKYLEVLEEVEGRIDKVLFNAEVGHSINPRSPQQVKQTLLELGAKVVSTDKETLGLIREKARPESPLFAFVDTLLEYRREAKLYSTYVKGIRKRLYRGRVYPTFLLHGTTTGRLSCRNPNLQNIPRESSIRRLFVPTKPSRVFVQADFGQAELRVATFLAQEEYFRDIFNDPERDLFNELTPVLYGDVGDLDDAAKKELRIRVKAYVYGLAYGREAFSIAQEFRITEREAARGMRAFFDVIPGIVAWRESIKDTVLSGQDLVSPFGRHRRFWLITEENRSSVLKEAYAFLPQSTSSDICLGAAVQLRRDLRGTAFLRNIVHDSILAECEEEDAPEVAKHMDYVMLEKAREVVGDYVKFKTDWKIGRSWAEV